MRWPILLLCFLAPAHAAEPDWLGMIDRLGAVEYRAREAAQAELLAAASEAPDAFLEAAPTRLRDPELDVEIRMRLKQVARQVLFEQVYNRPRGYLGLYLGVRDVLHEKRIIQAVRIDNVVEGGPAERAGLVAGDHIIGLNGEEFGRETTNDLFIRSIQSMRSGDEVRLTVLRGDRALEKTVVLGVCPPNLLRSGPRRPFAEFFADWWKQARGRE